ncbi:MAG: PIN domain-containing protein [Acidobacteria bacterium]|nr:PIN domain-containing protein [Acidobacteriota bacterium]MBI3424139.1 PIN domain-containing protein [Acidobacteriota bacterium]
MKLSKVLFDTTAYITYRAAISAQGDAAWFSIVVWQERMAGANGGKELKLMEAECKRLEKAGRLLIPDREAWLTAGRILNHYLSDLSRQHPTRSRPALSHAEKQNLIRDVLIAVSAKKAGVIVVSDNKDFPTLQRYYDFKWMSGQAYFAA